MFQALERRLLPMAIVLITFAWIPSTAQANAPFTHYEYISSFYQGSTSQATIYQGFLPAKTGSAVYPGVLKINPPDSTWSNYVHAAHESPKVDYTITSVTLRKHVEYTFSLETGYSPGYDITQSGDSSIRLVWPLLYESPGTDWILTVNYTTAQPYDDDGTRFNCPTTQHTELWVYEFYPDISDISTLLKLFHTVPFGTSGVSLINSEPLCTQLQQYLSAADVAWEAGDLATALEIMWDFELTVMDSVVSAPLSTDPGSVTGIANTTENPAACKLLMDVDFIMMHTGFGSPP